MEMEKKCSNCKHYATNPRVCAQCVCSSSSDTGYKIEPSEWEAIEDAVNHPKHYETGKFECIDVMIEAIGKDEAKGFCLCNAFKYIYRCTKKHDSPVEDVKKAVWYLEKFLELEGAQHDQD